TGVIYSRCGAATERNNDPSPKLSASHHSREPSHSPSTRIAAREKVASAPVRPRAEKMPRKAGIVIGLVNVKAKVDRKSRSRPSASGLEDCLDSGSASNAEPPT